MHACRSPDASSSPGTSSSQISEATAQTLRRKLNVLGFQLDGGPEGCNSGGPVKVGATAAYLTMLKTSVCSSWLKIAVDGPLWTNSLWSSTRHHGLLFRYCRELMLQTTSRSDKPSDPRWVGCAISSEGCTAGGGSRLPTLALQTVQALTDHHLHLQFTGRTLDQRHHLGRAQRLPSLLPRLGILGPGLPCSVAHSSHRDDSSPPQPPLRGELFRGWYQRCCHRAATTCGALAVRPESGFPSDNGGCIASWQRAPVASSSAT
jgi:hypothetical protein